MKDNGLVRFSSATVIDDTDNRTYRYVGDFEYEPPGTRRGPGIRIELEYSTIFIPMGNIACIRT